jgi:hypothetical protein
MDAARKSASPFSSLFAGSKAANITDCSFSLLNNIKKKERKQQALVEALASR